MNIWDLASLVKTEAILGDSMGGRLVNRWVQE